MDAAPDEPTTAPEPERPAHPTDRPPAPPARTPITALAIVLLLLTMGGSLEGYAVALAASQDPARDQSLAWALIGALLVATAWAARSQRWWAVSAVIAIALVGMAVGVYGALSLATERYAAESRMTIIGLVAVGAAAIVLFGLVSSSWRWLSHTAARPSRTASPHA